MQGYKCEFFFKNNKEKIIKPVTIYKAIFIFLKTLWNKKKKQDFKKHLKRMMTNPNYEDIYNSKPPKVSLVDSE